MATTNDLIPSLTDLPYEQALKIVLNCRAERKIPKNPAFRSKKRKTEPKLSPKALLKQMTPAQQELVMQMLMENLGE